MRLIISILIPLLVGFVTGFITRPGVEGWYAFINKPSFNPPNWVFAPIWTILYILMGIAFYIIWKTEADKRIKRTAIIFYGIQLALNFTWSLIFFSLHQPAWALADIFALQLMILLTIAWFGKISPPASWLLVPYICWVSFAAVLNYAVWKMN
ncbi:TspO/MBR family protein [Ferruginibacter sp.]